MPTIESIIDRQLRRWELEKAMRTGHAHEAQQKSPLQPVITVSRQRGSGGSIVAERVAERFHYTLLHRDLIDRICDSSGTVRRIVESLDEHVKPQITSWFESVLGTKYLDRSDYLRHLVETITSIAQLGGVVVVGRGANFIIGPEWGFHVRVVAPREVRAQRLMARDDKPEKVALHEVEASDHERAEFIRKVYTRDIDDPNAYDLVINTAHLPIESATSLVVNAAMDKFERLKAGAGSR
jgi:cytidylate kinase